MGLCSKENHNQIEKIIKEHVEKSRRTHPWAGEHKSTVKKIMKIIEEKS